MRRTLFCAVTTQGRPPGPTATEAGTCGCGSGISSSNLRASALKRRSSFVVVTMKTEPSGPIEMFLADTSRNDSQGTAAQRITVLPRRPQGTPSGVSAICVKPDTGPGTISNSDRSGRYLRNSRFSSMIMMVPLTASAMSDAVPATCTQSVPVWR